MAATGRLQLTLAILKPDIVANPAACRDVFSIILQNNFYVVESQRMRVSRKKAEEFYEEHRKRFFYNRLVSFMSSGPMKVHILAKQDACSHWRTLLGPTKVFQTIYSAPNSIRGKYGLTDTRNAAHGSDSTESANKEIKFFFPNFDVNEWYASSEPIFRKGFVSFNREKEIHEPQQSFSLKT